MPRITKDRHGEALRGKTWVVGRDCVWLSCFRVHDCGHTNSQGKWVSNYYCVTNYNRGCPRTERVLGCCDNPVFVWNEGKTPSTKLCKTCRRRVPTHIARQLQEQIERSSHGA